MSDYDVVRIVESSLAGRTFERAGRWIYHTARTSVLISSAARTARIVKGQAGVLLMAATFTHVALALTARPTGWYWLILPSMAATIAAILIYADAKRTPPPVE